MKSQVIICCMIMLLSTILVGVMDFEPPDSMLQDEGAALMQRWRL